MKKFKLLIIFNLIVLSFLFFKVSQASTEINFETENVFNNASSSVFSIAKLTDEKVVIAYQDGSTGGGGNLVVGQVLNNEITYGSEFQFNGGVSEYISVVPVNESKFLLAYKDRGNNSYGTVLIGEVDGTNVTFGSEIEFNALATNHVDVKILDNDKFVLAYNANRSGSNQGVAMIGQINGMNATFGNEYIFNPAQSEFNKIAVLGVNKFVVVYKDSGVSGQGKAVIGQVSDNVISFGNEYGFNGANTEYISVVNLGQSKFITSYRDEGGNLNYGRVIIGQVNENTISFGDEYTFNPSATKHTSIDALNDEKIIVSYQDTGDLRYGRARVGDIVENVVNFGEEYAFNPSVTGDTEVLHISNGKLIVSYQDGGGVPNYGTGIIGNVSVPVVEPEPEPQPEPEPIPEPELPLNPGFNDGVLIRNPDAQGLAAFDVYIIKLVGDKRFKRLILSPHVFDSYEHLKWSDIVNVEKEVLDAYVTSNLVRVEGGEKIYELVPDGDTGIKHWLSITDEMFIEAGYDKDSIYTVNQVDLDAYLTGPIKETIS